MSFAASLFGFWLLNPERTTADIWLNGFVMSFAVWFGLMLTIETLVECKHGPDPRQ